MKAKLLILTMAVIGVVDGAYAAGNVRSISSDSLNFLKKVRAFDEWGESELVEFYKRLDVFQKVEFFNGLKKRKQATFFAELDNYQKVKLLEILGGIERIGLLNMLDDFRKVVLLNVVKALNKPGSLNKADEAQRIDLFNSLGRGTTVPYAMPNGTSRLDAIFLDQSKYELVETREVYETDKGLLLIVRTENEIWISKISEISEIHGNNAKNAPQINVQYDYIVNNFPLLRMQKTYKNKNDEDLFCVEYLEDTLLVSKVDAENNPLGNKLCQKYSGDQVLMCGSETYEDGTKYTGLMDKNRNPEDKGRMVFSDGSVYEGDFKNGKKDGYGVYAFGAGEHAGDKYEGEWRKDKMHGKGAYTSAGGEKLEGVFEKGVFVKGKFEGEDEEFED